LNDGQEYDGLVFLATKFYNEYNGSARSNLIAIGVHEIAHQWWFGLVGSDQALEPWLDEALCVYSEALFYQYIYPNSVYWWWNFRVNYFGPSGWVDTNVYESGSFRIRQRRVFERRELSGSTALSHGRRCLLPLPAGLCFALWSAAGPLRTISLPLHARTPPPTFQILINAYFEEGILSL
jgi:hypothetical protein